MRLNRQHNLNFSFVGCQAGCTLSTNFALREVSTAAYGEQQTHLWLLIKAFGQFVGHEVNGFNQGVWPICWT
jgi:hypothetical protein